MPNPQNPELRRSEETLRPRPERGPDPQDVGGGETGPVPVENQAGHQPDQDQDKPPADKFAAALGIKSDREVEADEADEQSLTAEGGDRSAKRQGAAAKARAKKSAASSAAGDEDTATGPAKKATAKKSTASSAAGDDDTGTGPAKKAVAQKTVAKSTAARSGTSTRGGTVSKPEAEKATPKTTISSGPSAGRSAGAGRAPEERVSMGTAGATSKAVSADAPAQAESPAEAAAQHHHALPDHELPHDAGIVTPSGTPVTARVLTLPLKYWSAALRTSGGAIVAYGEWVRRAGERLTSGRRS